MRDDGTGSNAGSGGPFERVAISFSAVTKNGLMKSGKILCERGVYLGFVAEQAALLRASSSVGQQRGESIYECENWLPSDLSDVITKPRPSITADFFLDLFYSWGDTNVYQIEQMRTSRETRL